MRLYHRTTLAKARQIMRDRAMASRENTGEAYFSNRPGGYASGYGEACVVVDIPEGEGLARLDDEFGDGELHYAVAVAELAPEHFIGIVEPGE